MAREDGNEVILSDSQGAPRPARRLPAWHSADNAPAIVRRSCPSPWAWSNGSGRRAVDSATPWRAAGEVS